MKKIFVRKNEDNDAVMEQNVGQDNKRKVSFFKKFPDFLVKNRKSVVVVCCVAIISTAVYVDWRVGNDAGKQTNYIYTGDVPENTKILGEAKLVSTENESDQNQKDDFFVNAQMNKKKSRDESVEMLQSVVDSSETMPDVKDKALSEIMTIAQDISKEALVEECIKAKGFEDCVAVITGENINVIVKTSGLLTNEVAQIKEIVMTQCGFDPQNIKIVEKY